MLKKKASFQVGFILIFLLTVYSYIFSINSEVIKNPKPNMVEKNYFALKKIKTLNADLGNGEYLFQPSSITADKDSIYVFDLLQTKIFKFDSDLKMVKKSFGRVGAGPGEFSGGEKTYPVVIQIGRDGKLYASDLKKKKIIIFDQDGNYLDEFTNTNTLLNIRTPLVNSDGNILTFKLDGDAININNEKNSLLFSIANQAENFNYLFINPDPYYVKMASQNPLRDLSCTFAVNGNLLLYFPTSSTMLLVKNKKTVQMKIWPQEALSSHENELKELLTKEKSKYRFMFFKLIVDQDDPNIFYLQGINKKKGLNTLYQFNIEGNLLKVFYLKLLESEPISTFTVKTHELYYAIEADKLIIYKEEIK